MRRLLTASALVALAVFVTDASGQPLQPPLAVQPLPAPPKVEKKADPADAAIAAALANDPDVKVAKAKIQLAEAELAKARQVTTLRVLALKAKIDQFKAELRSAEERVTILSRAVDKGQLPLTQLLAERDKLEAAKSALAATEAELKLLTGGAADKPAGVDRTWLSLAETRLVEREAAFLQAMLAGERKAPIGAIPDRVRAALDKPVKLGAANEKVTFEQAVEAFKKAGLDVPVRAEFKLGAVVSLGEELPVGAWLQLFTDGTPDVRIVVREYGLLVTRKDAVPPDAPTVTEFWKQKPAKPDSGPKP